MSIAARRTYTPTDLLSLPDMQDCELIDGELVEKNMSFLSNYVEGTLFERLSPHCTQNQLGKVLGSSMGYQCFPWAPAKVRKPDLSFIRKDRITADLWEQGQLLIAPDLAAEVVSPNDLAYDTDLKIEEYLRAGIALIWMIYPQDHVIMVFRKDGTTARLRDRDELSGEDVVPGFLCRVNELFPHVG